MEFEVSYSL